MLVHVTRLIIRLRNIFRKLSPQDRRLYKTIKRIVGRSPINLSLYKQALRHTSASNIIKKAGIRDSNERLEYLGDAVLGAIVADFLFKKYPFEEEGFLTEIRARIVNREMLNTIARKIGLEKIIQYQGRRSKGVYKSMNGDALEALVGAIYLDRGFLATRKFILKKLIQNHYDIDSIVSGNKNYKSLIIEWAQKKNKDISFEIIDEKGTNHYKEFIAQVIIDGESIATGTGLSKKKAEKSSAEKACEKLKII